MMIWVLNYSKIYYSWFKTDASISFSNSGGDPDLLIRLMTDLLMHRGHIVQVSRLMILFDTRCGSIVNRNVRGPSGGISKHDLHGCLPTNQNMTFREVGRNASMPVPQTAVPGGVGVYLSLRVAMVCSSHQASCMVKLEA